MTFNFLAFPLCAQTHLNSHVPTSCDYGSITTQQLEQTNQCLCNSIPFLNGSAHDIYPKCGCAVLGSTADTINLACLSTEVTPVWSIAQYIAADDGGQANCVDKIRSTSQAVSSAAATSKSASASTSIEIATTNSVPTMITTTRMSQESVQQVVSTSTSPSQASAPTSSDSSSDEAIGLQKQPNQIALGCGLEAALIAVIGLIVTIVMCRRQRAKPKSEATSNHAQPASASYPLLNTS